jgi:hypothetical protein
VPGEFTRHKRIFYEGSSMGCSLGEECCTIIVRAGWDGTGRGKDAPGV